MNMQQVFDLPPRIKVIVESIWDSAAIVLALLSAFWLMVGVDAWSFTSIDWMVLLLNLVFTLSLLLFFGHYSQMIRYMSAKSIYLALFSLFASSCYLLATKYALNTSLPIAVPIIYFVLAGILMLGPRLLVQGSAVAQSYRIREKCVIFGAAETGRTLALALRASHQLFPVAFVDDKRAYQGKMIMGLPVVSRELIPKLVHRHKVSKVLLAVGNASVSRRKELITELEPLALELLAIPNLQDVLSGRRKIHELREIRIEELLGREPVPPIPELLDTNVRHKQVMVTGAGGSIGSELCRQIAKSEPRHLILYELSEFNLYQIESELKQQYPQLNIVSVLASVQDTEKLRKVIERHSVQTIYHAAAYKHVPMVENNIEAGVRNNIFGTANLALAAAEFEVEKFVLVSTDKAVRPTNVMGATKRLAELFVQGLAALPGQTEYAIVRFGNVLGSSGSVVPLFKEQIRAGGPVTVTHPDVIRYFMTIPEAAQLVIQAGTMGKQGEVFVLDMGNPVKIVDLAKQMAHLMGHSLFIRDQEEGDIELVFSGLRPGEKLYEELLIDESETSTRHPRIMGANEAKLEFSEVILLLDKLNHALQSHQEDEVKRILIEAPLAYRPVIYAA